MRILMTKISLNLYQLFVRFFKARSTVVYIYCKGLSSYRLLLNGKVMKWKLYKKKQSTNFGPNFYNLLYFNKNFFLCDYLSLVIFSMSVLCVSS